MIPTGGCYRRVRRERLLGEISGRRLTHPGLAGFPTLLTLHPRVGRDVGGTRWPRMSRPHLLVGLDDGDDAAVVRIEGGVALIATTDFFTPVVDDAYDETIFEER